MWFLNEPKCEKFNNIIFETAGELNVHEKECIRRSNGDMNSIEANEMQLNYNKYLQYFPFKKNDKL